MKRERNRLPQRETLGWIGIGVGLVGIAITVRPPVNTPPLVFWLILSLGLVSLMAGAIALVFEKLVSSSPKTTVPSSGDERRLLALECKRFSTTFSSALAEHARQKPRALPGKGAARRLQWRGEMLRLYHDEFRSWALGVFDAAVQLDGISNSSRVFVEAPSPAQLQTLPGLFQDAARTLEIAKRQ